VCNPSSPYWKKCPPKSGCRIVHSPGPIGQDRPARKPPSEGYYVSYVPDKPAILYIRNTVRHRAGAKRRAAPLELGLGKARPRGIVKGRSPLGPRPVVLGATALARR
jgi:hypothetical protein